MNTIVYIHGKGGNAQQADYYKKFFPECEVIGFDYKAETVLDAISEFREYFKEMENKCSSISMVAESIGAYYAMCSLKEFDICCSFFISPVLDMKELISDMMLKNGINEEELERKKEISVEGDILSWDYWTFAKEHPLTWKQSAYLLFGEHDFLTDKKTMISFAQDNRIPLSIMPNGEHWFHTEEERKYLDDWMETCNKQRKIEEKFDLHMVRKDEYEEALSLEPRCFPVNEMLPEEVVRPRMEKFPEYYMVAKDKATGVIAGSICGIATNHYQFRDAFFTDPSLHEPNGKNVMILGVAVLEEYRRQGLATALMKKYLDICMLRGQTRAVLTCVKGKVKMYEKMGFKDIGYSTSSWGNEVWHEMEKELYM